ncbi:RDD family protein [Mobilicoccus caccae]|uniref:RDD family protein n=1 Tax=Mobilicoccus caccae TaxID=1859295 RepID=A0ABQ6INA0_9MICO|nr:RDD family protein [Mobilicoccus caccae]GMA39398.1 RDD family protein [Mobilicoccus caccae]
MVDRRDIGSWLSGPPVDVDRDHYPGRSLGLPEQGPGSIAPFGRRIVALLVDGTICQVIAMGLFGYRQGVGGPAVFTPTLVFLALHLIMVATGGYTIGHRLLGLRVVRVDGGWAGPVAALKRTVLFALLIPVLIMDRDQRGLHDKLSGTVLVKQR